jgi:hypothetical protein
MRHIKMLGYLRQFLNSIKKMIPPLKLTFEGARRRRIAPAGAESRSTLPNNRSAHTLL